MNREHSSRKSLEHRQVYPEGYGYSRFCELFRDFEQRLSPIMRQEHVAGDKGFVDCSGKRVSIVDPKTGAAREAEIFVGVLGASNYTYAEVSWSQSLPDWIGVHVRMFAFYSGMPRLIVPDNLKSGVNKASFYDPEINRSYGTMAAHYGVGILPARPRKPRDKTKVEAGVRLTQTYILGRLRTAKLRQAASVEDVNYRAPRGLDRGLFQKLATNDWIRDRRNLLIAGPCGIGKSYLACALGHKACRDDLSAVYHQAPRLFAALALARGDGRYARVLRSIARIKLLNIDDWGPDPLNADQRRDLLEIVEDRYDVGSIPITSQLQLENWCKIIGDPTIADA